MQQLQVELGLISLVAILGLSSGHFGTFMTFRRLYSPYLEIPDPHTLPHDSFEYLLLVTLGGFCLL